MIDIKGKPDGMSVAARIIPNNELVELTVYSPDLLSVTQLDCEKLDQLIIGLIDLQVKLNSKTKILGRPVNYYVKLKGDDETRESGEYSIINNRTALCFNKFGEDCIATIIDDERSMEVWLNDSARTGLIRHLIEQDIQSSVKKYADMLDDIFFNSK